jgi:hypothetical protein
MRAAGLALAGLLLASCTSGDSDSDTAPIDGGMAVCDEATISAVIREDVDETYPGASFVSLESWECDDGWAFARAEVDTSGVVVPTAFFLRAEGQNWIPTSIEEICSSSQEESGVPDSIYAQACES